DQLRHDGALSIDENGSPHPERRLRDASLSIRVIRGSIQTSRESGSSSAHRRNRFSVTVREYQVQRFHASGGAGSVLFIRAVAIPLSAAGIPRAELGKTAKAHPVPRTRVTT